MKKLLPFLPLMIVVLACVPPKSTETPAAERLKITYSKPTFENVANIYTLLHFEVQNVSPRHLEYIQIHTNFYDRDGMLVTSESPYIDRWQGLAPGERSAATVTTKLDRRIKNYEITFTANGERPFEKVNLIAEQLEPPPKKAKKK